MINALLKYSILLLQSDASSIKIYGAMIATFITILADASAEFTLYEEYGLRALGGACIVWLITELRATQKLSREKDDTHKKEIKDMWDEHKREMLERSAKTEVLITKHCEVLEDAVKQNQALAEHLALFSKHAVEQTLFTPPPRPRNRHTS